MTFNYMTEYVDHRNNVVKRTYSKHPNNATSMAQRYMSLNLFGASVATVIELDTGLVHSVVLLKKNGRIITDHVREARKHETVIRLDILLGKEFK